jgi:hypothetical protein
MLDRIKKALMDASELVKEQANNLGDGAKEKVFQLIDEWLQVFPKLQNYGLDVSHFALTIGFNPCLEAELRGKHADFLPERVEEILKECRSNPSLMSVFTSIKTTYTLYRKINTPLSGGLSVRLKIKITPEIKVMIGAGGDHEV